MGKPSLLARLWYYQNKTKEQQQQLKRYQAPRKSQETWLSAAYSTAEVRGQENKIRGYRKPQVSAEMTPLHLEESSEKVNGDEIEAAQKYVWLWWKKHRTNPEVLAVSGGRRVRISEHAHFPTSLCTSQERKVTPLHPPVTHLGNPGGCKFYPRKNSMVDTVKIQWEQVYWAKVLKVHSEGTKRACTREKPALKSLLWQSEGY